MSQVTTHVLDTANGKPAAGISIILHQQVKNEWVQIANGITNKDGRIGDLLQTDQVLPAGIYKMDFATKDYFDQVGSKGFYPVVTVTFEITSGEHYHIPLLLSPFGYTTYRGS
ncbi:MAG: hydroxyisourate hydrolase [Bacteroidota bacterium]